MNALYCSMIAAAILLPASAQAAAVETPRAEPVELTALEMDAVTAGVGANNVAAEPWTALLAAGFSLNHNLNSDAGAAQSGHLIGVAVPSAVPNSFCLSFCV